MNVESVGFSGGGYTECERKQGVSTLRFLLQSREDHFKNESHNVSFVSSMTKDKR